MNARRLALIDMARTFALANMIAFHFLFDLRMYGAPPEWMRYGVVFDGWAKGIAGTFLFLAGLSLWMAHGDGFRAGAYMRRLAILAAAAAAVSLATYVAVPTAWVRFGILHAIAACSLLALPFLRTPWPVPAVVAVALLWWGPGLGWSTLNHPWLVWLGLGTSHPPMIDYEPVVPWLAPLLMGLVAGKIGTKAGLWTRATVDQGTQSPLITALSWPGKHSLAIYLLHQPILIGLILGWIWLAGLGG